MTDKKLNHFIISRTENKVEYLIEQFHSNQWKIIESKTHNFHKYQWPDIILSEEENHVSDPVTKKPIDEKEFYGNIELLGKYIPKKQDKDGQIVLYYNSISKIAEKYLIAKYGLPTSDEGIKAGTKHHYDLFTTIVLLHEFVHWIMDSIPDQFGNQTTSFQYETEDHVFFHEGFAQLFTYLICELDEELLVMFLWLEKRQSIQYLKYKELLEFRSDIYCTSYFSDFLSTLSNMKYLHIQSYTFAIHHLSYFSISDNHCLNDEIEMDRIHEIEPILEEYREWQKVNIQKFLSDENIKASFSTELKQEIKKIITLKFPNNKILSDLY